MAQDQSLRNEALQFDQANHISTSPLFLNLSGWINKGLLLKKRINLNQAFDRSPDKSELNSAQEAFVINYEYFFKDAEYKCRRPTYYQFYAKLLGQTPFHNTNCEYTKEVSLISESVSDHSIVTKRIIDPERIYQIHYLFAGKGKQMMSRWGHAMFRVILCAPGKIVGPSCLNDYSQHIVISYRANIEDMNIDYLKGMNGSYASQLFLMNMNEVVNEYTKGEFRDIISLPIKLSRHQIKLFSERLLENYWSYKGRYYFLTNNCATEAINLLRSAFPDDKEMQTLSILHPLSLYKFLAKNKLINLDLLNNTKEAISQGYLFLGVSEKLVSSLAMFINQKNISFEDFALKHNAQQRKNLYQTVIEDNPRSLKILANALRLEEQIQLSNEQKFAKKIGQILFGKDDSSELKGTMLDEKIIEMKELYKNISSKDYLAPGYGIPLIGEFRSANPKDIEVTLELIKNNMEDLKTIAFNHFPNEVEELKGTIENRQWILTLINSL